MSIRFKVIFPFLLLTLVVAVTGVYVVTRLVASSLNERLTNQLLEAGRVVSDDLARQEIKHIEAGRIVAFTRGLSEALSSGDSETTLKLTTPIAGGLGIENLILIDKNGWELTHLILSPEGKLQEVDKQIGAGSSTIVQTLLKSNDPDSLPKRGLGINPADERYYYFTAIPVPLDNQISGVVIVGTSLDTLLPYLKATSLADVILYGDNGQALITTLSAISADVNALNAISIPEGEFQQIVSSDDLITGENFSVDGRWYSLARGPLNVGNDRLGAFAVVLPLNYVLQAGAISRNTYIIIFTTAMISVVLIGYIISRLITIPLSKLVTTSIAIAGGDLNRRTQVESKDEIGVLANTFDTMTTKLQQHTIELEKTNRALERMDKTKSRFIHISAHELRTPLTLIQGYSQMVEKKIKDDPESESLVQGILAGTKRMTEIIDNMLDVSKIDNKVLDVAPSQLALDNVVNKAKNKFTLAIKERQIEFKIEGLKELPPVSADGDLLYKAFHHLIMNAIKFTPDGGKITVSGRTVNGTSKGLEVEVAIKDTGVGVDPENHELIFEKFFQTGEVLLHSSGNTKFKGGGPGLGLSIARGIVEAHHGQIWIESSGYDEQLFPGSTLYLRLPVQNGRV